MADRFSNLAPLSHEESAQLCLMLCDFFHPLRNSGIRNELNLPAEKVIRPLSLFDFFTWAKLKGNDLWPKMSRIRELTKKLEQNNILTLAGSNGRGPGLSDCYYFMYELSTSASKGRLWLGAALGTSYIGLEIEKDLALITGKTKSEDGAIGTGLLITPGVVITCAHVVEDMRLDDELVIRGRGLKIRGYSSSRTADLAVVTLEEKVAPASPDMACRNARALEQVVVAGYPTVPRGLAPTLILQSGEICGRIEKTMDGSPLALFSAIARPGNSGGPVVGLDGRVVGIVSRSLERQREEADALAPMPFFSAVPSDVIQSEFGELTHGVEIPWETYQ